MPTLQWVEWVLSWQAKSSQHLCLEVAVSSVGTALQAAYLMMGSTLLVLWPVSSQQWSLQAAGFARSPYQNGDLQKHLY